MLICPAVIGTPLFAVFCKYEWLSEEGYMRSPFRPLECGKCLDTTLRLGAHWAGYRSLCWEKCMFLKIILDALLQLALVCGLRYHLCVPF